MAHNSLSILDDDKNDDGHNAAIATIFWTNELKCRQFVRFLLYYACIQMSSFLVALIPAFIDIFLMENDGSIDTSAWNLPFLVVMPIDMQTILGWFLTWFYQLNMSIAYAVYMITTTTHFVCLCYWIIASCDYFARLIKSLKFDTQQIEMQKFKGKQTKRQWQNAKVKFQRAIELHVIIYE